MNVSKYVLFLAVLVGGAIAEAGGFYSFDAKFTLERSALREKKQVLDSIDATVYYSGDGKHCEMDIAGVTATCKVSEEVTRGFFVNRANPPYFFFTVDMHEVARLTALPKDLRDDLGRGYHRANLIIMGHDADFVDCAELFLNRNKIPVERRSTVLQSTAKEAHTLIMRQKACPAD